MIPERKKRMLYAAALPAGSNVTILTNKLGTSRFLQTRIDHVCSCGCGDSVMIVDSLSRFSHLVSLVAKNVNLLFLLLLLPPYQEGSLLVIRPAPPLGQRLQPEALHLLDLGSYRLCRLLRLRRLLDLPLQLGVVLADVFVLRRCDSVVALALDLELLNPRPGGRRG